MRRRKKRHCKVDVFFNATAILGTSFFDADFTAWFGTLAVNCTAEQAKSLLGRETVIRFDNGMGGSAKLFRKDCPSGCDNERRQDLTFDFYFVGTSPLLDLGAHLAARSSSLCLSGPSET